MSSGFGWCKKRFFVKIRVMIRAFWMFSFLTLLPISALLFFKPQVWQEGLSKIYFSKIEPKGNPLLNTISRSILAMMSTETGGLFFKALGLFLGVLTLWIFFKQLRIISIPGLN
jgi:hypothetical protein